MPARRTHTSVVTPPRRAAVSPTYSMENNMMQMLQAMMTGQFGGRANDGMLRNLQIFPSPLQLPLEAGPAGGAAAAPAGGAVAAIADGSVDARDVEPPADGGAALDESAPEPPAGDVGGLMKYMGDKLKKGTDKKKKTAAAKKPAASAAAMKRPAASASTAPPKVAKKTEAAPSLKFPGAPKGPTATKYLPNGWTIYTSLSKGAWRVKKEGVRTDHAFHWKAKAYTAKEAWDMLLEHVNYGK